VVDPRTGTAQAGPAQGTVGTAVPEVHGPLLVPDHLPLLVHLAGRVDALGKRAGRLPVPEVQPPPYGERRHPRIAELQIVHVGLWGAIDLPNAGAVPEREALRERGIVLTEPDDLTGIIDPREPGLIGEIVRRGQEAHPFPIPQEDLSFLFPD